MVYSGQVAYTPDLDVAINNQCGRLVANVMIAYNSILLSGLLKRCQAEGNRKAPDLLKRISPVAWQHIHFLGHYAFRDRKNPIDLEAIPAGINFFVLINFAAFQKFRGFGR